MDRPIGSLLDAYAQNASLRLHMPGHGGRLDPIDVTELSLTDDLLYPAQNGAIVRSEAVAAKAYGVQKTLYSCSGATLCIQAGLAFLLSKLPKKDALVACERRVHRSVLHALALLDIDPVFVETPLDLPEQTGLLIFCGCDYYGVLPDYAAIATLCRDRGICTLVDNAHGAHLKFWEGGKLHPARFGFDLIVDSAHKTLNCLTGGAMLHLASGFQGDIEAAYLELKHFFRVFSTSSPSFLILRSLEDAVFTAAERGERILADEKEVLDRLRARISAFDTNKAGDPFRLVLRGAYDFEALYGALCEKGVVCEFYERNALVMIPRFGFSEKEARVLEQTLQAFLPRFARKEALCESGFSAAPERKCSLRQALLSKGRFVASAAARGCVAGEVVGRYPPGNGLILPGEVLTEDAIACSGKSRIRIVEETF